MEIVSCNSDFSCSNLVKSLRKLKITSEIVWGWDEQAWPNHRSESLMSKAEFLEINTTPLKLNVAHRYSVMVHSKCRLKNLLHEVRIKLEFLGGVKKLIDITKSLKAGSLGQLSFCFSL